jgi:hypothetical protein
MTLSALRMRVVTAVYLSRFAGEVETRMRRG